MVSHADCGKVQDAYSMRCMPQVHGSLRDAISHVTGVVECEMNAATDNPLVFADTGEILSGGNFHAQPVALAADFLAAAVADLSSISERRVENLVNPDLSGLPGFLKPLDLRLRAPSRNHSAIARAAIGGELTGDNRFEAY